MSGKTSKSYSSARKILHKTVDTHLDAELTPYHPLRGESHCLINAKTQTMLAVLQVIDLKDMYNQIQFKYQYIRC